MGLYDSGRWCECQPCRATSGQKTFTYHGHDQAGIVGRAESDEPVANVANGYLKFMNVLSEKIENVDPNALITYYFLYNIPGFAKVRPHDNVLPVMCHIKPRLKASREEMLKWEKISNHLYYYTYVGYRLDVPKLEIGYDIRWCHEHKGIGIYFEEDGHTPVNMLGQYLAMRFLWDIDARTEDILERFYR